MCFQNYLYPVCRRLCENYSYMITYNAMRSNVTRLELEWCGWHFRNYNLNRYSVRG